MTEAEKKKTLKQIQRALDRFPRVIAEQRRRYEKRQKFLREIFGPLIRELDRLKRRNHS